MGDDVTQPDRNGVRTPMQWTDDPGAGFSSADPDRFWPRLVSSPDYVPKRVNVSDQINDEGSLLNAMRRLVALRKELPILALGSCRFLQTDQRSVTAYLRGDADDAILVVANLAPGRRDVWLEMDQFVGRFPRDLLTGERLAGVGRARHRVSIDGRRCLWLRFEEE